jgi:pimeloyl-ACP methyl ester carboxylesterase
MTDPSRPREAVDLDIVDDGRGSPVVFCHGGASDRRYWEPQRPDVVARYRFVAYSQRRPTAEDPPDVHTDDLVMLIRGLEAGPVHLVGFSSATALRAAIRAPDAIRSLTILEPNVPWLLERDADGQAILAAWQADNERLRAATSDADERARLWFELVNNRGAGTFDAQPAPFRRMWLENFGSRSSSRSPAPLTCGQLATIGMPTLVLATEYGMTFSRRIAEEVAGCITASELVVIPDATHFVSYQAPDRFNRVVLDFLAGLPDGDERPAAPLP